MNLAVLIPIFAGYILILAGLAYYGYKKTISEADYLIAGGDVNPLVMALSYGATFISTSSLIGFGGVSANDGFGLLWLAFLNIVFGIFVAFAVLGKRIRRLSVSLNVFTLPSMLGAKYESKFITVFSGIMIFVFMPAYTSIVLIGGGRVLQENLDFNYHISLLVLAILVGFYVISGGLKAVMYSDAFAAIVMLVMMVIFLVVTYQAVGGITAGHVALSNLKDLVPQELVEQGHRGWTSMPEFGSPMWLTLVTTLIMGVGIGVLAQPQLAMRSMTVKNDRDLNRSVLVGGVFIFFMAGAVYMIGPLSNIIFQNTEGKLALEVTRGNVDLVIPALINTMMPEWFIYLFTLTALSAGISTISSLMHVQATSFSEDILKTLGITSIFGGKISMVRFGVIIGVIAAVILAFILPGGVIAQATSFWFGICAAGFLPVLIGALFWKKGSRSGANTSVVAGFVISIFGFLFLHEKESAAFGVSNALFGKASLFDFPITHINPIVYALPISAVIFVVVSLVTYKEEKAVITEDTDASQKEVATK